MTIYERIDELRKEKGVKWGYLNDQIGAYRGKLTEVKNGKTTLSDYELEKIAEVLGTSVGYLLGSTDNACPPSRQKETSPEQEGQFSEKDVRLIAWFRSLPPEKQRAILIAQDGPKDLAD